MQNTEIGRDIEKAAYWLRRGKLVAIPTETVYGLAANALNPDAVLGIFEAKNRPAFDPLIVHIGDRHAITQWVEEVPVSAQILADAFWPGPLTLLLPKRSEIIPDLVTSGLPHVGLRMPSHPLALALLRALPFPLAAPSANPFGYISPTTARHVQDQLGEKVAYILDGGACEVGVESTIVGFDEQGAVVVHRLGGIAVEDIEACVGRVKIRLNQSDNPAAPGMLTSHYAPRKPLYLNNIEDNISLYQGKKIGLMTLKKRSDLPANVLQIPLSETGLAHDCARNLFAAMRTLDAADIDLILAETLPDTGLGRAVNDRLRRAAAK